MIVEWSIYLDPSAENGEVEIPDDTHEEDIEDIVKEYVYTSIIWDLNIKEDDDD